MQKKHTGSTYGRMQQPFSHSADKKQVAVKMFQEK